MTSENGYNYQDYDNYDEKAGRDEFRCQVNVFLNDYKDGFELSQESNILALGKDGLEHILNAEIVNYDSENIEKRVESAILKWRNRHLDIEEKKQAIVELANIFEWLKKTGKLKNVLDKKDERVLFEIANNFSIRHHNPDQRTNYDKNIWYSWIFHFYLATYHAVIRLIKKNENQNKNLSTD